jgi:chromosome segregation ATPase
MARPGVTYSEVVNAITQIIGQGKNPTVEQVRFNLGTGSSTTIANHLRQWKANQESTTLIATKENIPSELVAVMKGLWERVVDHSQEKITALEVNHQEITEELQQELEKYKANNQRWQKMHDQWHTEKAQLANDKLALEQALEFIQKENASLQAKQDMLLQQLDDKQVRVEELHRLHSQTQANLEHYREASREQRLLDQQQYEQQKQQLQFEIKSLNEQLIVVREESFRLQHQCQSLQQSHQALQVHNEQTVYQLEQVTISLGETEKAKNEYLHVSQHWQQQYAELQKILNDKTNQLIDVQSETKSLLQQLKEVKSNLSDSQDQNKLLSHERWVLAQEKAQFEGQLKQMQKMIVA